MCVCDVCLHGCETVHTCILSAINLPWGNSPMVPLKKMIQCGKTFCSPNIYVFSMIDGRFEGLCMPIMHLSRIFCLFVFHSFF